jgi:hypothetical protein
VQSLKGNPPLTSVYPASPLSVSVGRQRKPITEPIVEHPVKEKIDKTFLLGADIEGSAFAIEVIVKSEPGSEVKRPVGKSSVDAFQIVKTTPSEII